MGISWYFVVLNPVVLTHPDLSVRILYMLFFRILVPYIVEGVHIPSSDVKISPEHFRV